MVPFGTVVFPIVGTRGVGAVDIISGFIPDDEGTIGLRPVIGVIGDTAIGVNMARFVPCTIEPIPMTQLDTPFLITVTKCMHGNNQSDTV